MPSRHQLVKQAYKEMKFNLAKSRIKSSVSRAAARAARLPDQDSESVVYLYNNMDKHMDYSLD